MKIRGFRVEPGEIEAAMKKHPFVQDAVVVPVKSERGIRRLHAYAVPKPEGKAALKATVVNEHLKRLLPPFRMSLF